MQNSEETLTSLIDFSPAENAVRKDSYSSSSRGVRFGNIEVDSLNVQACLAVTLCCCLFFIASLFVSPPLTLVREQQQEISRPQFVHAETGEELVDSLKAFGLWDIDEKEMVPSVLFSRFPENINQLDIETKKKIFLHTMLPAALIALSEIESEKNALAGVLDKFPHGYKDLVFSDDFAVWGRVLTMDEIEFVLMLTRKYRTNRALELTKRIDTIPLSLILAQGAIESSWGTSRFTRLGNNLFGLWTWGEKGIVPTGRDDGKHHKVAIYDTIIDSIRAYVVTLNRLPAYRNFREIRHKTKNSIRLADGLLNYSERRESYVRDVKRIIRYNKLRMYDSLTLYQSPVKDRIIESNLNSSLPNKNAA